MNYSKVNYMKNDKRYVSYIVHNFCRILNKALLKRVHFKSS